MDGNRFDALTRAISFQRSRRGVLIGLTGGVLALLSPSPGHEADARRKKKKKKKSGATAPPPPGGCPGGQKPCAGGCIPTAQCCTNADCPISGQVCGSGQCACPAALPEICGGACLASCGPTSVRNPGTCACCLRIDQPSVNATHCCSHILVERGIGATFCTGRDVGDPCELDDQCDKVNCVAGNQPLRRRLAQLHVRLVHE
jgi:hypothetical protein